MIGETTSSTPLEELERRRAEALAMGGEERIERHHASGRLTARERIAALVDAGLLARDRPAGAARAAPRGAVARRRDHHRPRPHRRAQGRRRRDRRHRPGGHDRAGEHAQAEPRRRVGRAQRGLPLIFLVRQRRRPAARPARLALLRRPVRLHARSCSRPPGCPAIPRITAVLGPSFGDAALHAAIADLVVMKRDAAIALSGPPVILGAIGEEVSDEELGGPAVAHETSRQRARRRRRGGRGDRRRQALPLLPARRGRPAGAGGTARRAGARRRGAAHARARLPAPRL